MPKIIISIFPDLNDIKLLIWGDLYIFTKHYVNTLILKNKHSIVFLFSSYPFPFEKLHSAKQDYAPKNPLHSQSCRGLKGSIKNKGLI